MTEQVAHVWGFYDADGHFKSPNGVAVSSESAHEAFRRMERHFDHHGYEVVGLRVTRRLDGFMVAAEWDVPAADCAARIWHRLLPVNDDWPDFPATAATEEPTT